MKTFLLLMQYCIYKSYCKFFRFNPMLYTYKLPFAKKLFAKSSVDPLTAYKDVMNSHDYGFATMFSRVFIAVFLGLIITGFFSFFSGIFRIKIGFEYQIIISFITSFLFCPLYLWKKNQHFKEFNKFDKMQKWKKFLWLFLTLVFFVISIVIWWKGMNFWDMRVGNY